MNFFIFYWFISAIILSSWSHEDYKEKDKLMFTCFCCAIAPIGLPIVLGNLLGKIDKKLNKKG